MDQNRESDALPARRAPVNWLAVAVSAAVLTSGLNALLQACRTLFELGRLAGW